MLWLCCRCYVNPMTCQHRPFLSNNGQVSSAWDSCMNPGMNTTIDAGAPRDFIGLEALPWGQHGSRYNLKHERPLHCYTQCCCAHGAKCYCTAKRSLLACAITAKRDNVHA